MQQLTAIWTEAGLKKNLEIRLRKYTKYFRSDDDVTKSRYSKALSLLDNNLMKSNLTTKQLIHYYWEHPVFVSNLFRCKIFFSFLKIHLQTLSFRKNSSRIQSTTSNYYLFPNFEYNVKPITEPV